MSDKLDNQLFDEDIFDDDLLDESLNEPSDKAFGNEDQTQEQEQGGTEQEPIEQYDEPVESYDEPIKSYDEPEPVQEEQPQPEVDQYESWDGQSDETEYSNTGASVDDVLNTVEPEKPKKGKKNKDTPKTSSDNDPAKKEKVSLFILTDKLTPYTLEFVRNSGLAVSNIFTSVEDLRSLMMTTFGATRIVVVESGTGRFVAPATRKDLIDTIGMADTDVKITVFYTNNLLREDAKNTIKDNFSSIEWIPFKCTAVCVAVMMMHTEEEYVYDTISSKEQVELGTNILEHVGKAVEGELSKPSGQTLNLRGLVDRMGDAEYKEIPAFEVDDFSKTYNKLY